MIVPSSTGVMYSNQVCGFACRHPEVEGFVVPIDDDANSLAVRLEAEFDEDAFADLDNLRKVDAAIREFGFSVDYSRLNDSMESWVYVTIESGVLFMRDPGVKGSAILTWPNSD